MQAYALPSGHSDNSDHNNEQSYKDKLCNRPENLRVLNIRRISDVLAPSPTGLCSRRPSQPFAAPESDCFSQTLHRQWPAPFPWSAERLVDELCEALLSISTFLSGSFFHDTTLNHPQDVIALNVRTNELQLEQSHASPTLTHLNRISALSI